MLEKLLEPARARIILVCLGAAALTCLAGSLILFTLALRTDEREPDRTLGETATVAAKSLLDYWALGFLIAMGLMGAVLIIIALRKKKGAG